MNKIVLEAKVIMKAAKWITGQIEGKGDFNLEGKEVEIDLSSGKVELHDRNEGGMAISKRDLWFLSL